MRVLTIVSNFGRRGTQRVAENFSCAYAALGHQVAVLAFENQGPRLSAYTAAGVTVLPAYATSPEASLTAARAFEPSLIHIHRSGVGTPRETAVLRELKNPNNCVLETNVFSRFDPAADPYIDLHAQLTRPGLYRWHKLEHARSRGVGFYLPNLLNYDVWQAAAPSEVQALRAQVGIPTDSLVLGTIGKTDSSIARVVQELVSKAEATHWVAIDSEATQKVVSELSAGARNKCHLLPGADDDSTLKAYYGLFDLLLHHSPNGESFGMVLAESIAVGTPVIMPLQLHRDIGGVEVLGHEQGGLIAGSARWLAETCRIGLSRLPELRRSIVHAQARHRRDYDQMSVAERALTAASTILRTTSERSELESELSRQGFEVKFEESAMRDLVSHYVGERSTWETLLFELTHSPRFNDLRRAAQSATHALRER
jgi:glycosyltransferase involved in cell wall biosynthesis